MVLAGATVGAAGQLPERAPRGNRLWGDFDENVSASGQGRPPIDNVATPSYVSTKRPSARRRKVRVSRIKDTIVSCSPQPPGRSGMPLRGQSVSAMALHSLWIR